jgi:PAS domain S-box-containing protein
VISDKNKMAVPDPQPISSNPATTGEEISADIYKDAEQNFKFLFDYNPVAAWIFDLTTLYFLKVNKAAIDIYGYTEEEFLSMKLTAIRPEEDTPLVEQDLKEIREGKPGLHERTWRHKKKNGELIYVETKGNNFSYQGKEARLVLINDITERIKTEEDLIKSNEQYRLANERFQFAAKVASDIIWDWDIRKQTVEWSENFRKILGHDLPADSTLPISYFFDNLHEEDRKRVKQGLDEVINHTTQKNWECEFRFKKGDGTYAFVEDKGYIVRNDTGKAVRLIGAMKDYSERKYQEDLQSLELKILGINSTPGISFIEIVNNLLEGIEAIHPEMYSSVLLLTPNNTIKNLAAPRLPKEYLQAIDGLAIGPKAGSCGTAMYFKQPIIVSDIDQDPLWESYKSFTDQFGLKACWSVPIIHSNGIVMGSFAIYYHTPKSPSTKEWHTVLRICDLIKLLMENNNYLEQIKLTNERYNIVANATHDMVWDWNLETNELYRDPKGLFELFGIQNNELIKHINKWLERIHPDDLPGVHEALMHILNTPAQNIFDIEYRFRCENGDYAYVHDRGYILRNSEGKAYRMIGAARDITDRKKLEQEIVAQQKAISQATINTQEKERTEISKELHDNVNQVLTTTKLYLDLAMANPELKDELIKKSSQNIINVITEIRSLSQSLMIPSLGDLGLIDSIEDLAENINVTKKVRVFFKHRDIDENFLDDNQKLTLFRIIQEGLNNVIKHSGATRVIIELSKKEKTIQLDIKDNGKGFDLRNIKKGFGLNNIRNRVYLLNGNLTVETQPGKGCTLVVELPHHSVHHFS